MVVAVATSGPRTTFCTSAPASTAPVPFSPATFRAEVTTDRGPVVKTLNGKGLGRVTDGAEAAKGPDADGGDDSLADRPTVGVGGTAPRSPVTTTPVALPETVSTSAAAGDA